MIHLMIMNTYLVTNYYIAQTKFKQFINILFLEIYGFIVFNLNVKT